MPRLPADYSNTIIYKLCCLDPTITDIYIGQTTLFSQRKYRHKSDCLNEKSAKYNRHIYTFIRENGGWDNWTMIQIEEYPCKHKREAECRETYWIKELNATLNSMRSYITEEDRQNYRKTEQYRLYKNAYMRQYKKTEKYKLYAKEYNKKYYLVNKNVRNIYNNAENTQSV